MCPRFQLRTSLVLDRVGREAERFQRGDRCRDDLSSVFSGIPARLVTKMPARNRGPAVAGECFVSNATPVSQISTLDMERNMNRPNIVAAHARLNFPDASAVPMPSPQTSLPGGTTIALLLAQQKTNAR
jgi:hypothetical protein